MELKIQDLVSSIRKEGVDAANEQAAAILAEAKQKADGIVAAAKAEAKASLDAAEKEISILRESAAVSAEQAKRDAMLAFKANVKAEFEKILACKIKNEMSGESLGKLIKASVAGEDVSKYSAEVSEVSAEISAQLADEIKNGLELKASRQVQAGFRLAAKDGSGYFDCSDDEVMQMLMPYFRNLDF